MKKVYCFNNRKHDIIIVTTPTGKRYFCNQCDNEIFPGIIKIMKVMEKQRKLDIKELKHIIGIIINRNIPEIKDKHIELLNKILKRIENEKN